MGKLKARQKMKHEYVRVLKVGAYEFKPNMKVVWNWTSANCKKSEQGFYYVVIKQMWRNKENGQFYFSTKDGIYDHDFAGCVKISDDMTLFCNRMNMRPYEIDPLTDANRKENGHFNHPKIQVNYSL